MRLMNEGWRYFDLDLEIPYPWYTKPCLEWLKTIDLKGKEIFEYGVGDSTTWYKKMGAFCWGVDDSVKWSDKATQYEVEKMEYINAIGNYKYDIVVIDGSFRDECTQTALSRIKKGGYLIIDNWKQPTADLEHWPLTEVLITGMDVTLYFQEGHQDWCSAVIHVI